MSSDIILRQLIQKSGIPTLMNVLNERLAFSELHSLLMEVFRLKSENKSPADLLKEYQQNRFVRPSSISAVQLLKIEQLAYERCANYEPILLSPLAPLGNCSVLGNVSQNKIVAANRNTEIVADNTNLMALEIALRRKALLKANSKDSTYIRLCSNHRLVRAQMIKNPDHFAHFKVFALCAAGRDRGSHLFERESLKEQLLIYLNLLQQLSNIGYPQSNVQVGITPLSSTFLTTQIEQQLFPELKVMFPNVTFKFNLERQRGRTYYQDLCFNIDATTFQGKTVNLADGGFTNWTQQLLSNKKERLLISGMGTELLVNLFFYTFAPNKTKPAKQ